MTFILPSSSKVFEIAPHLIPKIVFGDNKFWFVKSDPGSPQKQKIDLLAYKLGKDICNISEVRTLSEQEVEDIRPIMSLQSGANNQNTYLVRFASTYGLDELPCNTLEKAVATELVYSTFIRRRDTHALNREYTPDGIPVFYDSHIAFLIGEQNWVHSTVFLKFPAGHNDYGRPIHWRVKEIQIKMSTQIARSVSNPYQLAWHYIKNIETFKEEMTKATKAVLDLVDESLENQIVDAGFDPTETEIIHDFLKRNSITLQSDIEEVTKIVLQP